MAIAHDTPTLLRLVTKEVKRAMALNELVLAANRHVAGVNELNLVEPFELVRESLHRDLCLTLIKLFDAGPEDVGFPTLISRLKNDGFRISKSLALQLIAWSSSRRGHTGKSFRKSEIG